MPVKTKILVVDDEASVALMIVFLLTRAGYDAHMAWGAERALRLAQTEKFDLVTSDIDMPGINGFELFRRLKEIPHLKETPVVFISGNATIENQQYALDLGAKDFIEKPFGVEDFLPRIFSCLNKTSGPSDVLDERADANAQSLCNAP